MQRVIRANQDGSSSFEDDISYNGCQLFHRFKETWTSVESSSLASITQGYFSPASVFSMFEKILAVTSLQVFEIHGRD